MQILKKMNNKKIDIGVTQKVCSSKYNSTWSLMKFS